MSATVIFFNLSARQIASSLQITIASKTYTCLCTKSNKFSGTKIIYTKTIGNVSHIDFSVLKGHVINGVLISREAAITISCKRGIPSVTFISPRPARWKVFKLKKEKPKIQVIGHTPVNKLILLYH